MDIKAYISSGILEHYVLGKLSSQEMMEVERFSAAHPEIREELNEIEWAIEEFALLNKKTPPQGVLEEVLREVKSPKRKYGLRGASSQVPSWWRTAALLLLALAASAGYFAYTTYKAKNPNVEEIVARYQTKIDSIQAGFDTLAAGKSQLKQMVQFLRNPDTQPVVMQSGRLPEAVATVYFNKPDQKAYLDIVNFPEPPSGKQYQLWGIVKGNPPINMGVLDIPEKEGGLMEVSFALNAQIFVITLENEGGSLAPTLDQAVVSGKVGG